MYKRIFPLLVVSLLLFIELAAQERSVVFEHTLRSLLDEDFPALEAPELKALLEEEDIVLLDARALSEYKVSHLKGAIWIGYTDFKASRVEGIERDNKVVVYCSVGYRSEELSRRLQNLGFNQVLNLYGGIFDWHNKGYPIYANGERISRIHGYDSLWSKFLQKGEIVFTDE